MVNRVENSVTSEQEEEYQNDIRIDNHLGEEKKSIYYIHDPITPL